MEMRGIEPRAFHMQSERSTTELHPRYSQRKTDEHGRSVLTFGSRILEYIPKYQEGEEDQGDGETKCVHVPTGGLEPPIFGLGDRRLIH